MKKLLLCSIVILATVWAQDAPATSGEVKVEVTSLARGTVTLVASVSESLVGKVEKLIFLKNAQALSEGVLIEGKWSCSWDTRKEEDGEYKICAQAVVAGQNFISPELSVAVDNTPPQLRWQSAPQKTLRNPLVCEVIAQDQGNVEKVTWGLEEKAGLDPVTVEEEGVWRATWDKLPEGDYTVTATASDRAGNTQGLTLQVKIDETPPKITWSLPLATPTAKPLVIQVEVEDLAEVSRVTLAKGDTLSPAGKNTWRTEWTPPGDGEHQLAVRAEDAAGNAAESEARTAVYDTTPPAGELILPEQAYFRGPFVIKARAEDALCGVEKVTFKVGERNIDSQLAEGFYCATIDLAKSGNHQIGCVITDKAGNSYEPTPQTVAVDRSAPDVKTAASFPLIVREKGQIALDVHDDFSKLARVIVTLGERVLYDKQNPEPAVWIEWEATEADGKYPLLVTAEDRAGNSLQKELGAVLVDKTCPEIGSTELPATVPEGVVWAKPKWKDELSGIDKSVRPEIVLELQGSLYSFQIESLGDEGCEARLLITKGYAKGAGEVYLSGLRDRAGNTAPRSLLGKLQVETSTLSGKWPVEPDPADKTYRVFEAYAKDVPQEISPIWIASAGGSEVKAIASGRIVEISASAKDRPGYVRIEQLSGEWVWGYHNIFIGQTPALRRTVGDIVEQGDVLGKIPGTDNATPYLYLELVAWKERQWVPVDSPLKYLAPDYPSKQVSPKPLLEARSKATKGIPDLDFTVPLSYYEASVKQGQYKFSDFLVIIYAVLVTIALLAFVMFRKSAYK